MSVPPPSTFSIDSLDDDTFEGLCSAMPGEDGEKDLRRSITLTKAQTRLDVYVIASQAATIDAGGRGALFGVEKALKAFFFEAYAREESVITKDIHAAAEALLATSINAHQAVDAMQEVMEYVLKEKMPLLRLIDNGGMLAPDLKAIHPSFQAYYAAAAIRDFSWKLESVPWQLGARWSAMLEFGSEIGDPFWRGLLQATPAPGGRDPLDALHRASQIRNLVVAGDNWHRPTSLYALGGLLKSHTEELGLEGALDWSELALDDVACQSLFAPFTKGTLRKITRLYLSDNPMDVGGMRALATAFIAGAFPQLEELRLSNTMLGDPGVRALAEAVSGGHLEHLKQLYLNYNEIGDAGVCDLAEAVKPTKERPNGALANLEVLTFAYNNVEDQGIRALAGVADAGALGSLMRFSLAQNARGAPRMVLEALERSRKPRPRKVKPLYQWPEDLLDSSERSFSSRRHRNPRGNGAAQ